MKRKKIPLKIFGTAIAAVFLASLAGAPAAGVSERHLTPLRDPTVPSDSLAGALDAVRNPGKTRGVVRVELADKTDTNAPAARMVKTAEFSNTTFGEAARALAEATGLNIAPSAAAAATRVQLYLSRVPAQAVLENLCTVNGLWFRHDLHSDVLRVFTVPEFKQDLASFQEEKTRVFTLSYPNAVDIAYALQNLFGERMLVDFRETDGQLMNDLQQRFSRFDLVDQRSQGFGVAGQNGGTSGLGGGSSGGSSSIGYGGMGYGGSQNTRPVSAATKIPVATLDAEQIQTLQQADESAADARPASGATEKIVDKRVNIYVSVLRRQNRLVVRTANDGAMEEIAQTIASLDVPTSQVLLEMKVLSIQLGDGFNSAFDYTFANGQFSGSLSSGTIAPPAGSGQVPGGTGLQADNLIFQYIGDTFSARLQLLESKNRVTALATPMLLAANNEVSRVFVGENVPINTSFTGGQTVSTGNSTYNSSAGTGIQFTPIGTTLLITPSINADHTVTLRVLQENSAVVPQGASVLIPNGNGFQQQSVDVVQSRSVSGTFVAKDRLPVAIGGLISEDLHANSTGVPYVDKIPLVGQLFRRDDKGRSRNELVVIVKPYILNTPSEAEVISSDLLKKNSLHPNAASMDGTLKTYQTNQVPAAPDTFPLAPPK